MNHALSGNRRQPCCHLWRTHDGELLRSRERLLVVVEIDVRLVEERDVEVEGEVAVGALGEREARMPAVQIPLQPHVVLAKLASVEVVDRVPGQGPVRRGTEPRGEGELLAAPVALPEEGCGQGAAGRVGARTVAGERHRHVKTAAAPPPLDRRVGAANAAAERRPTGERRRHWCPSPLPRRRRTGTGGVPRPPPPPPPPPPRAPPPNPPRPPHPRRHPTPSP